MWAEKPVWVDRMQRIGKMANFRVCSLLAGATILLTFCGNARAGAGGETSPPANKEDVRARVSAAAMSWPLRFEENVGQVKGHDASSVRYLSRGSAYTLFLTSQEAVLVLGRHPGDASSNSSPVVVRMRLAGGSRVKGLTGVDELPGKSNYFIGNDPSQWHAGVANYRRVVAKSVYPGIDLVYHGNQGQLEYDFEVAPHVDPAKIRFALEGAQSHRIDSEGDLLVSVQGGELRFRRPVAYQRVNGAEQRVPVRFVLKGKKQVEFGLAAYDRRQALVIDPILAYSTYLGGSNIDSGNGIAVAPDGSGVRWRWDLFDQFSHCGNPPSAAERRRAE